jgi:hypothetical protein
MVIVPADQVVLVGVGLVDDAVIHDQNRVLILYLPHEGLDDLPQVLAGHGFSRQEAGDLIVAQARPQQARQPCGGRWAKGRDQVVGVQVQKRLIQRTHNRILPEEN